MAIIKNIILSFMGVIKQQIKVYYHGQKLDYFQRYMIQLVSYLTMKIVDSDWKNAN